MPLLPGYNIVTQTIEETEEELGSLEFFRKAARNAKIQTPTTVVGLEDLLYNAEESARPALLKQLRQVLRNTDSVQADDAVQLLVGGEILDDTEFRVRIERSGDGVYLDVGQLFVEEPRRVSSTQAVARK